MRVCLSLLLLGCCATAQPLDSIWITNSANNTVYQLQRATGATLATFATPPGRPVGCTVRDNGECWVAIQSLAQVLALNPNGTVKGTFAVGAGRPTGMGTDLAGNVWCGNLVPGFVRLTPAGVATTIVPTGSLSGQAMSCDSLGDVWAGDGSSRSVYKIAPNGQTLLTLANIGHRNTAIDHSDNVYTAGFGSTSLSKWTNAGTAINSWVLGNSTIQDVHVDADDNVWIANQGTAIFKFNSATTVVSSFATGGSSLLACAIDGTNEVWVCNYGSASVTVLRSDGTVSRTIPVGSSPIPIGDNSGFQRAVFTDPFGDVDGDGHPNNAEATSGANLFDPAAVPCTLTLGGSQARGGTATLSYVDWGQNRAGLPYAMACSLSLIGNVSIGPKRRIDLTPDSLFFLSLTLPQLFQNFLGTLDASQRGLGTIHIPNIDALKDVEIHCSVVTIDPSARDGIRTIAPRQSFKIK